MTTSTSERTVDSLRIMFATYGLPKVLVTYNGPQFISAAFQTFLENNGVRHLRLTLLQERAVQTFKWSMEKNTEGSITTRLSRFLFLYRRTPHTITGVRPAELLLGQFRGLTWTC